MVNLTHVFEKFVDFLKILALEKGNNITLNSHLNSTPNIDSLESYLPVITTFLIKCVCFFEKTEITIHLQQSNSPTENHINLKIYLPKFYFNPNLFLNKNDGKILQISNDDENFSVVFTKIPVTEAENFEAISNNLSTYIPETNKLKTEYLNQKFEGRFKKTSEDSLILNKLTANTDTKNLAFLEKVNCIIEKNLANETFDSNDLIKKMDYSKSQLFRKLKQLTKLSTSNYIKYYKLQISKELLLTTDLNISEIAFKVGFSDISYFTNSFKKQYGLNPSQFRLQRETVNT